MREKKYKFIAVCLLSIFPMMAGAGETPTTTSCIEAFSSPPTQPLPEYNPDPYAIFGERKAKERAARARAAQRGTSKVDPTRLDKVLNDDFNVERDLKEYKDLIGLELGFALKEIQSNSTWVDMGAGGASAQRDFLSGRLKAGIDSVPNLLAIAYKIPDGDIKAVDKAKKDSQGRFQFKTGMWSNRKIMNLAPVDLITDVMGIFEYSDNKPAVIKSYLQILRPGGKAFIYATDADVQDMYYQFVPDTRFIFRQDRSGVLEIERPKPAEPEYYPE